MGKTVTITPSEVADRLKRGKTLSVIDVREGEEFRQGSVPGAKNIPLAELSHRVNEIDPKQTHIMVCRSGNRSRQACTVLEEKGIRAINMTGGMLKWDQIVNV